MKKIFLIAALLFMTSFCMELPVRQSPEEQIIFRPPVKSKVVLNKSKIQQFADGDIKPKLVTKVVTKPVVRIVVFNPNNINEISNISYPQLSILLKNTGMEDITSSLIQSEQEYGINALFLSGLIALESGWGGSDRARNTNNMGGVAVYNNNSRGMSFTSRGESVLHIARLIKKDYLNKNGQYYSGDSIWNINSHYCVSSKWSKDIISIANELLNKHKGIK